MTEFFTGYDIEHSRHFAMKLFSKGSVEDDFLEGSQNSSAEGTSTAGHWRPPRCRNTCVITWQVLSFRVDGLRSLCPQWSTCIEGIAAAKQPGMWDLDKGRAW
jgi:hypothetical protein